VLQRVAVCCSVSQHECDFETSVLQCVAVCCSVLQCAAVCRSMSATLRPPISTILRLFFNNMALEHVLVVHMPDTKTTVAPVAPVAPFSVYVGIGQM